MQTIFALATARGKSGVAVLRVSGPEAFAVARALGAEPPGPQEFALTAFRDAGGEVIDRGLILAFAKPRSFTGEDVVEFQVHGSLAVISAMETAIAATGLARPAEAGEFTKRALQNNRLDLAQVEGLGDLIEAETEAQRRLAMNLLGGQLRARCDAWRDDLLQVMALLESTIDFADEDVPEEIDPRVSLLLERSIAALEAEIAGSHANERIRDGFEVAILGPPNAGKSTLLNAIARREVAITSEIAGTTRDVLELRVALHGLAVTFLDTAGLRETEDRIERIGVDRARARAEAADLRLVLSPPEGEGALGLALKPGDIVVESKADLSGGEGISAVTGQGVEALLQRIGAALSDRVANDATAVNARQRHAMQAGVTALRAALQRLESGGDDVELIAEDVRTGAHALDTLVGRVDVEAILGEIFSRFCIGK